MRSRSSASHCPKPALSRFLSKFEVAILLRSFTHTHHRQWRSSQDFSRSSCTDQGRPVLQSVKPNDVSKSRCLTMRYVIFRCAQRLSIWGEEFPETVIRCLLPRWSFHRLGQWILRDSQGKFRPCSVNRRDTAFFAEITTASSGGIRGCC